MKVLVACEYSAIVREAFASRGHDVWSCDLLPSEQPGQHIQGDAIEVAYGQHWDLMIAHPPCTFLCNSGVRWLKDNPSRWADIESGAAFFKKLMDAPVPRKCLENPVMHHYAIDLIGRRHSQVIQPYRFGHAEQKMTCLWLINLPPLYPTRDWKAKMQALPKREQQRIHYMGPSRKNRGLERSRFYPGFAAAMADQWGSLPILKAATA